VERHFLRVFRIFILAHSNLRFTYFDYACSGLFFCSPKWEARETVKYFVRSHRVVNRRCVLKNLTLKYYLLFSPQSIGHWWFVLFYIFLLVEDYLKMAENTSLTLSLILKSAKSGFITLT